MAANNRCGDCGGLLYGERETTGDKQCDCYKESLGQMYGWVCPVCGRGNSPYSDCCHCIDTYEVVFGACDIKYQNT